MQRNMHDCPLLVNKVKLQDVVLVLPEFLGFVWFLKAEVGRLSDGRLTKMTDI